MTESKSRFGKAVARGILLGVAAFWIAAMLGPVLWMGSEVWGGWWPAIWRMIVIAVGLIAFIGSMIWLGEKAGL